MNVVVRRFIVFALGLAPFIYLIWRVLFGDLGPDPAKTVVVLTGEWTLYFLFVTLLVTPFKRFLGWSWMSKHRRMLGLFSLFYAVLHLSSFLAFILAFDLTRFTLEFIERPYISVGLPAFLILVILGVTSTQGMIKKLGKNWVKLHSLVYLALVSSWVHIFWQVRASYFESVVYGLIVFSLLGMRLYWGLQKRWFR